MQLIYFRAWWAGCLLHVAVLSYSCPIWYRGWSLSHYDVTKTLCNFKPIERSLLCCQSRGLNFFFPPAFVLKLSLLPSLHIQLPLWTLVVTHRVTYVLENDISMLQMSSARPMTIKLSTSGRKMSSFRFCTSACRRPVLSLFLLDVWHPNWNKSSAAQEDFVTDSTHHSHSSAGSS